MNIYVLHGWALHLQLECPQIDIKDVNKEGSSRRRLQRPGTYAHNPAPRSMVQAVFRLPSSYRNLQYVSPKPLFQPVIVLRDFLKVPRLLP